MTLRHFVKLYILSIYKRRSARKAIARYLQRTAAPCLNIGGGSNLIPGWLNTDLYPNFGGVQMDASRRWPIADGTFVACLCEHMIEHVPKATAIEIIARVYRGLRPGGYFRVVTPDLDMFSRFITQDACDERQEYMISLRRTQGKALSVCDAVNDIFYNFGHRYIYSVEELSTLLTQAGFVDLKIGRGGIGIASIFENADGHMRRADPRMNEIQAFAIEARKPPLDAHSP